MTRKEVFANMILTFCWATKGGCDKCPSQEYCELIHFNLNVEDIVKEMDNPKEVTVEGTEQGKRDSLEKAKMPNEMTDQELVKTIMIVNNWLDKICSHCPKDEIDNCDNCDYMKEYLFLHKMIDKALPF